MNNTFDIKKFIIENRIQKESSISAEEQALTIISNCADELATVAELSELHGMELTEQINSVINILVSIYNDATANDGETHGY